MNDKKIGTYIIFQDDIKEFHLVFFLIKPTILQRHFPANSFRNPKCFILGLDWCSISQNYIIHWTHNMPKPEYFHGFCDCQFLEGFLSHEPHRLFMTFLPPTIFFRTGSNNCIHSDGSSATSHCNSASTIWLKFLEIAAIHWTHLMEGFRGHDYNPMKIIIALIIPIGPLYQIAF